MKKSFSEYIELAFDLSAILEVPGIKEQHAAAGDHDQVGETGMHAHADQDRLAASAVRPGLGHLVGAVMDDGITGQGETQCLHDGALGVGFGGGPAVHRAALPASSWR